MDTSWTLFGSNCFDCWDGGDSVGAFLLEQNDDQRHTNRKQPEQLKGDA